MKAPFFSVFIFLLGCLPSYALGFFSANSSLLVTSIQVANNTTAIVVSGPAALYGIQAFNNSSTIAYIKSTTQRRLHADQARRKLGI